MKALIFAAGLGTRLKPITDTLPKALVPVCGEPLLYHVICKLRSAGYDELVVNVHHFPEQIKAYLASHDFGVKIGISDESERLLETGGGIAHARTLLEPLDQPFLIHNVDIVSNLDLSWFRSETRPGALATLLVSERQTSRYLLFNGEMRLVGWTNVATGEVRSPYPGLRPEECRRFAFAGIHNIGPGIFDAFAALDMPERFPIMDFYLKACADYPIYGVPAPDLTLVDVGKIDTLADAERICATLLP
ncbi:MAG: NTP transferase domain-containing protein [Bacteroidales bacterium]|nr:NTP transferase domain-containing protein [Bacteroidales bacterium]